MAAHVRPEVAAGRNGCVLGGAQLEPPGQSIEHSGTSLFGTPLPDPGDVDRGNAAQSPDAPTERLPIYDAVLSQWFASSADTGSLPPVSAAHLDAPTETRQPVPATNGSNGTNGGQASAEAPPAPPEPRAERERSPWTSPGDDGWLAAQALLEDKTPSATTSTVLPKRVPKAHLVPGSAAPRTQETAAETTATPQLPPRTANAVRGRMSSFQQGVRRGRHAVSSAFYGDQAGPESSEEHQ